MVAKDEAGGKALQLALYGVGLCESPILRQDALALESFHGRLFRFSGSLGVGFCSSAEFDRRRRRADIKSAAQVAMLRPFAFGREL